MGIANTTTMARRLGLALAGPCALLMLTLAPVVAAVAKSPSAPRAACAAPRCGLRADGAYPNYVIGRLARVGAGADLAQVFDWAKHHGYWRSLPSAMGPYLADVTLLAIRLPSAEARQPITVFVTRQEYRVSPYRVGDLVRYSPHGADHEIPPKPDADDAALFHGLTGCVALLCRRGDRARARRYLQGVFTKTAGRQVDVHTGRVMAGGSRIDPVSLLPVG